MKIFFIFFIQIKEMAKNSKRRSVSKKQRKSAKKSGKTHPVKAHMRRTPSGKRIRVKAHRSH